MNTAQPSTPTCPECGGTLRRTKNRYKHGTVVHGVVMWKCDKCGRRYWLPTPYEKTCSTCKKAKHAIPKPVEDIYEDEDLWFEWDGCDCVATEIGDEPRT